MVRREEKGNRETGPSTPDPYATTACPPRVSKAPLSIPFPPSASRGSWRESAGFGAIRARPHCKCQPAGGPCPAAWLLLLQKGNLTPASPALRYEWTGKAPLLLLFAPQAPATWLAWWDRCPRRYDAELPSTASAPTPAFGEAGPSRAGQSLSSFHPRSRAQASAFVIQSPGNLPSLGSGGHFQTPKALGSLQSPSPARCVRGSGAGGRGGGAGGR